jgi:hypothetical protein
MGFFIDSNSGRIMGLGSTQPLTKISGRNVSSEKRAGAWG